MRTLLVLVAIAALALIAAMQFGLVSIDQTSPAVVKAPTFDADVARVNVGTERKTVEVPTVDVQKPAEAR